MLDFVSPNTGEELDRNGDVLTSRSGEEFPIVNGIPRFVDSEHYAAAFGLEWNEHPGTLLDSHTGTNISRDRLEHALGCPIESLRGKTVLEAGCGSGRFTELLVNNGALVHAMDLSTAVDANKKNIGDRENYSIAQADLQQLPFRPESFDLVLCLGVLQHTPSPEASIRSLWSRVRPGGSLVIDHYTWTLSLVTKLAPVYRLLLKRMEPRRAKSMTDRMVDFFFPLHWAVRNRRPLQMILSRISPCLVYFRVFPEMTREQHYELSRLDTFDHLTDWYKHMRTGGQIRRLLNELGAENIDVEKAGNGIEARCTKPAAGDRSVVPTTAGTAAS